MATEQRGRRVVTKWWAIKMLLVWRWRLGYWDWDAFRSAWRIGLWRQPR